jgi:hypothetical protein
MKLLIPILSLIMIVAIACGDSTPEVAGLSWDDYMSQIDTWQQEVGGKLAEADELLAAGPLDNDDWLTSVNDLGIEIDSITHALTTLQPPSQLEEFHDSFILASDFYKLTGRFLAEFTGDSEEERAEIIELMAAELAFGVANIATAQSIFEKASEERGR